MRSSQSVGSSLGTGVILMARFASVPVRFLQGCGWTMILLSVAGNYLFGMGDRWWSDLLTATGMAWVGFAVVWQAFCYAVQWGCLQNFSKYWWLYFAALALSVVPAFIGYNDVVFPWIATALAVRVVQVQVFGLITLVLNDFLPEKILGK